MGRSPCCEKNGLKKGPWTTEEDEKLIDYIQKNGYGNWRTLPQNAGLQRCGKSCRLRWTNYLRPDIKRGRFSFEEEEMIIHLHSMLGNKWSAIAGRLPGRTDNEIKNYWNTHIRKRLLRMGIDPITHSPRLDLLDLSSVLSSSMYNSTQMNISRLLAVQPWVNPELFKLATSLVTSQCNPTQLQTQTQTQTQVQNQSFILENAQENNQICDPRFYNQIESLTQETRLLSYPNVPQIIDQPEADRFTSSLFNNDQYLPNLALPNDCDYFQPQQQFGEPKLLSEVTNFNSNYSNGYQNFDFTTSVLSTPSSSSTPLTSNNNSGYDYNNGNSEDDREISYGNDFMKFKLIQDLLDVDGLN